MINTNKYETSVSIKYKKFKKYIDSYIKIIEVIYMKYL